jgi:hypothetical protein
MAYEQEELVRNVSLEQAVKMLEAAKKEGIDHVISIIRDPRDKTRILSITAAEVAAA